MHSLCSASSLARTHLSQAGLYAERGGGRGGELGVFKKRGGVAARNGLKYNGSVSWIGMFSTPLISLVVNVNIFMI